MFSWRALASVRAELSRNVLPTISNNEMELRSGFSPSVSSESIANRFNRSAVSASPSWGRSLAAALRIVSITLTLTGILSSGSDVTSCISSSQPCEVSPLRRYVSIRRSIMEIVSR